MSVTVSLFLLFLSVAHFFLVCFCVFLSVCLYLFRFHQAMLLVLNEAQIEIARLLVQLSLADRFSYLLFSSHLISPLLFASFSISSILSSPLLFSPILFSSPLWFCLLVSLHALSCSYRPLRDMMNTGGKGRTRSLAFEHQVRSLLATGSSARAAREQLLQSAREFLRPETAQAYELQVPNLRWFQGQREALGNEAWLYGMIELTRANECLQHGFDETLIDDTPTLNQWALLHDTVCRSLSEEYGGRNC